MSTQMKLKPSGKVICDNVKMRTLARAILFVRDMLARPQEDWKAINAIEKNKDYHKAVIIACCIQMKCIRKKKS